MTLKQKRERIKFVLSKLTDGNREVFMRMYSPKDKEKNINDVVDSMPAKNISWALSQTENTYYKIFKQLKNS